MSSELVERTLRQGHVITGGVGFGKTTLVEALAHSMKCRIVTEIATELIRDELEAGGRCLPWVDHGAFEPKLLKKRLAAFCTVGRDETCFFDRGIRECQKNRVTGMRCWEAPTLQGDPTHVKEEPPRVVDP